MTSLAPTPALQPERRASSPGRRAARWAIERAAMLVTLGSGLAVLVITALIVLQLYNTSADARHKFGWQFLTGADWDPGNEVFGARPFIIGTVVTAVLSLVIALPLGLGSAIFLAELAPRRISNFLTFLIELLVAVPSVVYGLLGIFVLIPILHAHVVPALQAVLGWSPLFAGPFNGVSVLSAAVVLEIMVVPFIVSVSREVLLAVPVEQREGSLALGATRWETTWKVVVPYARTGITGSVFLALARALGETMAVTMVIGNSPDFSRSLLAPGYTIAAVIANEFNDADGVYKQSLILLGLVLFGLTIVINALGRLLVLATGGSRGSRR